MYVACEEHIEHVIDQYVDEKELSPDLHRIDTLAQTNRDIPAKCHLCSRPPVYLLT